MSSLESTFQNVISVPRASSFAARCTSELSRVMTALLERHTSPASPDAFNAAAAGAP